MPALAQVPAALGNAVPQGSPLPYVLPSAPPPLGGALPSLPGPAQPTPVPAANVAVQSAVIEGATAFPDAQLQPLIAGTTGPAVSLASIEAARLAILNLYRQTGYALITVNAALDRSGRLRFVVIEGYIAKIRLEGDIGAAATQALRFLNNLVGQRPIDDRSLARRTSLGSAKA